MKGRKKMVELYNCIFIIPYHKDTFDQRLGRAINSYNEALKEYVKAGGDKDKFKLVIMSKKDFTDEIFIYDKTLKGSTYPFLVNAGIEKFKEETKYISILEYDDILTKNSLKIFDTYVNGNQEEDVGIYAPLTFVAKHDEEKKDEKPALINVINEACMAQGVSEEYGYIDFNMMLRSNFLFVNGSFIKSEVFDDIGVFKTNFKWFYDYEWALRAVYNGVVIKAVPKATHIHFLCNDSLFNKQNSLPRETIDKWISLARREYFFNEERPIDET